jgi:hypothetical protein
VGVLNLSIGENALMKFLSACMLLSGAFSLNWRGCTTRREPKKRLENLIKKKEVAFLCGTAWCAFMNHEFSTVRESEPRTARLIEVHP